MGSGSIKAVLAGVLTLAAMGASDARADEPPADAGRELRLALALHRRTAATVAAPPEAGVAPTLPTVPAPAVAGTSSATSDEALAQSALQRMSEHLLRREGGQALALPVTPAFESLFESSLDRVYADLIGPPLDCCNCVTAASCDDSLFCNGVEFCSTGICTTGVPPCVDGDACTSDQCTEGLDLCAFAPVPPPAEVASLSLDRPVPASTVASLNWSAVSGASSYHVYRGEEADLADLACFASGVPSTAADDDGSVAAGGLYVFLVAAEGCGESSLGDSSFGPRPPTAVPCP
jgi:hypothetical protein